MGYSSLAISSALLYGFVSVSTTLSTKLIVSSYQWRYTSVLVLMEKITTLLILFASGRAPRMSDMPGIASKTKLLSVVSLVNALVSITTLEGLNIPMYNCLKRLTSLVTLAAEAVILRRYSSRPVQVSEKPGVCVFGACGCSVSLRSQGLGAKSDRDQLPCSSQERAACDVFPTPRA